MWKPDLRHSQIMSGPSKKLLANVRRIIPPMLEKFHKGCDMSHVICEPSAATVIKSYSPNLMVHPILQSSSTLSSSYKNPPPPPEARALAEPIVSFLSRLHVLVIGPGLGRDPTTQAIVVEIIKEARSKEIPIVLDADALLLVQEHPDLIHGYAECILTPNVVEFARLAKALGVDVSSVSNNDTGKSEACKRLSTTLGGVTIIQKGPHDTISNGIANVVCDVRGGLKRSGGQGDTLTGSLGTLLAWRKAYHEGLWETGESEAEAGAKQLSRQDVEAELSLRSEGSGGGDQAGGKKKKLSRPATLLLVAWAGSAITRECSRRAFVAKGRSMQASDLTDEVHESFLGLIGEPGETKLLAQWEGVSRKWYYVQRATGRSQWEIPTEPFIPTPSSTPQSVASPGPYHPPRMGSLPAQDTTEATRELLNLRGGNLRQSGGSFPTTPFDSSQTPQSGQDYQQVPSPGTQSTPVGGSSTQQRQQQQQQQSRSPSQGILGQVASDLAHRAATQIGNESQSNQQALEQTQVRYSPADQPSPYTNVHSQPQFHQSNQIEQGTVQMQDVNANTAASYQAQLDSSSAYHTDADIRMHQSYTGQQAGPLPTMESQYNYQQNNGQQTTVNSYSSQSNVQLLMQPNQPGQYTQRPMQIEHNPITIIHPNPNAPPLFPIPHRGGPRQTHGSRPGMTTTPPRHYPSHPAPHYNPHPSMVQHQYGSHHSSGQPGPPPNSHSPSTSMPRGQQAPYPPEGMYQQNMGPPSQNHNMYGTHQTQPNYAGYDPRLNTGYGQLPPQNMHDDQGMQRQTSQGRGQHWHGHSGSAPSPPGRYPPAHPQQHYGGGYGR
ncbi:ATP-dependent (S)-NAD(P)H-hydrate dehydratase [Emergomyces africanus]|uniref:ATP-dependent (S)-NAD(P)H-hydrate dehydratase n=1 Tax=Emergomyces africanus TaxID=1955775 RepID=A0A1B7P573_9EURO|nr:ATP-dependent (S)-NAD(P)H-hydrate dehydratase [Emergomyces africanus]